MRVLQVVTDLLLSNNIRNLRSLPKEVKVLADWGGVYLAEGILVEGILILVQLVS